MRREGVYRKFEEGEIGRGIGWLGKGGEWGLEIGIGLAGRG